MPRSDNRADDQGGESHGVAAAPETSGRPARMSPDRESRTTSLAALFAMVALFAVRGGHAQTLGTDCTVTGTPGADVLVGTPGRDVLCGGGGKDVLDGAGGNDVLK